MSVDQDRKKLLEKKNVVAVGRAKEKKDGQTTGRETLTAFVQEKKPESELDDQDIIPKETDKGKATDVVEIGRLNIENEVTPDRNVEHETRDIETNQKHRPFPQGSSIGSPSSTAGTAGLVLWKRSEKEVGDQTVVYPEPVGYTNRHVIPDDEGDIVMQPGKYDGGRPIDDEYVVGKIDGYVELKKKENLIDGAWYSLKEPRISNSFVLGMGSPNEKAVVSEVDLVKKGNTRTTAYREGKVLSTDADVRVNYGDTVREFEDQYITESVSRPGDSGSAIFDEEGKWIGNLFAGSSKVSIISKADHILDETPLHLNMADIYDDAQGEKI